MDIDCDGTNRLAGACANDPSGQSQTAFQYDVQQYNVGINDLDANKHPYVVFGNYEHSPSYDPKTYGIKPLSVMAVVCGGQMVYTSHPVTYPSHADSWPSIVPSGETQMAV